MPDTLVIQSHRRPLSCGWFEPCLESVAGWAESRGFDYRFIDDDIFDLVDSALRERFEARPAIISDLARLKALQQGLEQGYRRVVWCDADLLIFAPRDLQLPNSAFALGREVWIQPAADGGWRSYFRVHNALLMFARGNAFLDFYADTAERLLRRNQGRMPPQFIGPKLLAALHNIAQFPVIESAAMLSPPVMRDLLAGGGDALALFRRKSVEPPAAANLCASLVHGEGFTAADMQQLIDRLLTTGIA
ncbi:MAG TPA: hypothetical protein VIW27_12075 [Gammaproteobacteria bacterium]|jgi:hypothetical protein